MLTAHMVSINILNNKPLIFLSSKTECLLIFLIMLSPSYITVISNITIYKKIKSQDILVASIFDLPT